MIRFEALGVPVRIPLLTLLFPLLASALGAKDFGRLPVLALCLHEAGHLLCARLLGVEIRELRLLPIGGSIRMENPYRLPAAKLAAAALSGPGANLITAVAAAAMAHWGLLRDETAGAFIRPSLLLMFFNLLPALPLDGGRALYALTSRPDGGLKALRRGIRLGYALAAILCALSLYSILRSGRWNLAPMLAAIFILASAREEAAAHAAARAQQLSGLLRCGPRPARIYQLDENESLERALSLIRPREDGWFVLTRNGRPSWAMDSAGIIDGILSGACGGDPLSSLRQSGFIFPTNN